MRQTLRDAVGSIDAAKPEAVREVTEAVTEELGRAFTKHKEDLADLSSSGKSFFGLNVVPWLVTGGLTIAAASAASVPLAIAAAAVPLVVGGRSLKDLWIDGQKILSRRTELRRSPTGILFRHLPAPKK